MLIPRHPYYFHDLPPMPCNRCQITTLVAPNSNLMCMYKIMAVDDRYAASFSI